MTHGQCANKSKRPLQVVTCLTLSHERYRPCSKPSEYVILFTGRVSQQGCLNDEGEAVLTAESGATAQSNAVKR
jgi:hypothetical protein